MVQPPRSVYNLPYTKYVLRIFGYIHSKNALYLSNRKNWELLFSYGALDHLTPNKINFIISDSLRYGQVDAVEYLLVHGYLKPDYTCPGSGYTAFECGWYHPGIFRLLAEYKFPLPETEYVLNRVLREADMNVLLQFQISDEFLLRIYDAVYIQRGCFNLSLVKIAEELQKRGCCNTFPPI